MKCKRSKPPPDPKATSPRVCNPFGVKIPPDGRSAYLKYKSQQHPTLLSQIVNTEQ